MQRLLQCLTRPSPQQRVIQLGKVAKKTEFLVFEAVESGERRYATNVNRTYFHREYPDHISHVETLAPALELRLVHAGRQLLFILEERIQARIVSITALYYLNESNELVLIGTHRALVRKSRPAECRLGAELGLLAPLRSISALRLSHMSNEGTDTRSFESASMTDASVQAVPYPSSKSLLSVSFLANLQAPKRLNPAIRSISHCKSRSQPASLERLPALHLRSPLRIRK